MIQRRNFQIKRAMGHIPQTLVDRHEKPKHIFAYSAISVLFHDTINGLPSTVSFNCFIPLNKTHNQTINNKQNKTNNNTLHHR
jgi:hypothetical protein